MKYLVVDGAKDEKSGMVNETFLALFDNLEDAIIHAKRFGTAEKPGRDILEVRAIEVPEEVTIDNVDEYVTNWDTPWDWEA